MIYGVLSSPLELTGDFEKDIDIAYEYFSTAINDRKKRPTLFDKEVFIEAHEIIEGRPEGFWHVISLEENHHFKVLPCVNDGNIELCKDFLEMRIMLPMRIVLNNPEFASL